MVKEKIQNFHENESVVEKKLKGIFGYNFTANKSFALKKDVDINNEEKEMSGYEAVWTELVNPGTGEVVEAKVYVPSGGVEKVFIVSPGYKGDFVLQESDYADDFAKDGRAVVVLRHNGLRIDNMDQYIHCPEKVDEAKKTGQKYLGPEVDFSFEEADKEVLTALKAMSDTIDQIETIDILGHSWGAKIAISSSVAIKNESTRGDEVAEKIKNKIDNLIIMGAFIESRAEIIEKYRDFFKQEAVGNNFRNMDGDEVIDSMVAFGQKLKDLKASDLPENIRLVGIHSVGDTGIDLQGETLEFFKNFKDMKRKGSLILKDLKEEMPEKIGGRESESHDYAAAGVRGWIKKIIK